VKEKEVENKLSHINETGDVNMVAIGHKNSTIRAATAQSVVLLPTVVLNCFQNDDIVTKKGSVFQCAKIAGIMAAKKAAELIPLCHHLNLSKCDITIKLINNELLITCTCSTNAQTGVEMEALTGASITALTIYDMCKALSHNIVIKETRLLEKTGGKADFKLKNI